MSYESSADHEYEAGQEYELVTGRMVVANVTGPLLEIAQNIPGIHDVMAEPFDITNHAGNLWGGTVIAAGVTLAYSAKHKTDEQSLAISEESMSRFRRRGVAVVMGATALANCITETKWGVQHLPVGEWLNGDTPDVLDTVYSAAWGGILSLAFWKKAK